jgi:hypothetical protein
VNTLCLAFGQTDGSLPLVVTLAHAPANDLLCGALFVSLLLVGISSWRWILAQERTEGMGDDALLAPYIEIPIWPAADPGEAEKFVGLRDHIAAARLAS